MEEIITALEGKGVGILLVTSTPFINELHVKGPDLAEQRGLDECLDTRICAQTRDLAAKQELPLCDLHKEFQKLFAERPEKERQVIMADGVHLGGDSKAVKSYAKGRKDPKDSSDPDADWGKKVKRGQKEDGTWWEKVDKWFGYKLHSSSRHAKRSTTSVPLSRGSTVESQVRSVLSGISFEAGQR